MTRTDEFYQYTPIEEVGRQPAPASTFHRIRCNELMAKTFAPVRWAVPGYLPEGLSVLAGKPKQGKTWLAYDFALAIAAGGCAMGSIQCEAGDVLYIDMENGERRIQDRVNRLFPGEQMRPDLSRLEWTLEAPLLNAGFIEKADAWVQSVANPRLIVIDVLQRTKPVGRKAMNAYENDYAAFADLQGWAIDSRVAVLGLHHTRKQGADDPLESLTGSNGLAAVADTILVLDRDASGQTLYVRGRDVEEKETALRLDGGIWTMLGDADQVRMSEQRVTLAVTLRNASEPLSPQVLSEITGMKPLNVRKLLHCMVADGEAEKIAYGQYIHPDNDYLRPSPQRGGNSGNTGNTSADDPPP